MARTAFRFALKSDPQDQLIDEIEDQSIAESEDQSPNLTPTVASNLTSTIDPKLSKRAYKPSFKAPLKSSFKVPLKSKKLTEVLRVLADVRTSIDHARSHGTILSDTYVDSERSELSSMYQKVPNTENIDQKKYNINTRNINSRAHAHAIHGTTEAESSKVGSNLQVNCEQQVQEQKDRIGETGKEADRSNSTRHNINSRSMGKISHSEIPHGRRTPNRTPVTVASDAKENHPATRPEAGQGSPGRKAQGRLAKPTKAVLGASQPAKTPLQRSVAKASVKARQIALGQKTRKIVLGDDKTLVKVREMTYTYEMILGEYSHHPALKFVKGMVSPENNPRAFGQFKRAALIADQIDVDYETYLRAQFYWFDKWFNRAPKPYELSSLKSKFPAPERVRKYLQLLAEGKARKVVTCIGKRVQIDSKEIDKCNDRKMSQLMQQWGLPEEIVLLRFARPGIGYFDQSWLRKNKIWIRLRQEGRL